MSTRVWSDLIMGYVERTDEQLLEDERERINRLYGKDSENACSSMDWRISGWSQYVEDRGNGCLVYNASPVDELHISTGDYALGGGTSYYFRVQLYPYIVRILIDEGRWSWFLPPASLVSDHVLGWTVE